MVRWLNNRPYSLGPRSRAVEHREYLERALATKTIGSVQPIDDKQREFFEALTEDDDLLFLYVFYRKSGDRKIAALAKSESPIAAFKEFFDLPPIYEYRVPFEETTDAAKIRAALDPDFRKEIDQAIADERRRLDQALTTGLYDATRPMDDVRRAIIEDELKEPFDPEELPDHIPTIFQEASCNRFGRVCPVFFAAEALNETQKQRRGGRYIPFKTKMRVVRRDNYTCQHSGAHLRDDEVEFDHVIPISKGGSSEEHNIRLTCFDCNRDKSDQVAL
jgi:hypothetical protein